MYLHTNAAGRLLHIVKFTVSESSSVRCGLHRWFLALFWIAGLISGAILAMFLGDSYFPLMRIAASRSVSIVTLLLITCLPFLFSVLAVYISRPVLMPVIAFCKAAVFALVSAALCRSYGGAGWMVRSMVMFADIGTLPFLYGFWQRHMGGSSKLSLKDMNYVVAALLFCGLDAYWIAPFFIKVLQY